MKQGLIAALVAGATLAAPAAAVAGEGDVIVRYRAAADARERGEARGDAGVRREQVLPVANLELVDPESGVTVSEAVRALERSDDVLYAEPDVPRFASATPNDPLFRFQWGLESTGQAVNGRTGTADADVDAGAAWDTTTGAPGVTIGVIDTGLARGHADIAPNLYVNPRETPENGADDDRNGFVDDVSGWDFVERDNIPQDADGHGTHVAGTAAARGNDGVGVTGAAWQASIVPLRVLGDDGSGSVADAIMAYGYAARMGLRIVNLSLGGPDYARAELDAIAAAPSTLFVAAAGNEGANNDTTPSYPCNHDLPNVICVAASDRDDALASFSNRGARTVDLAAPGVDIAGPWPDGDWALLDGTSMATPLVSGAAALLLARQPDAGVSTLRRALLTGVDRRSALEGVTVTGGRLNAAGALAQLGGEPVARGDDPAPSGGSTTTAPPPAAPAEQPPPAQQPAPGAPPASAPATAPSTLPIPDRTAPFLRVSTRRLSGGRLRVTIRCDEPCSASTVLRRGTRTVARRGALRVRAGAATITLRPAARHRRARLTLRVTASDPAENRRTLSRRVRIAR
jgi:thermitase